VAICDVDHSKSERITEQFGFAQLVRQSKFIGVSLGFSEHQCFPERFSQSKSFSQSVNLMRDAATNADR